MLTQLPRLQALCSLSMRVNAIDLDEAARRGRRHGLAAGMRVAEGGAGRQVRPSSAEAAESATRSLRNKGSGKQVDVPKVCSQPFLPLASRCISPCSSRP